MAHSRLHRSHSDKGARVRRYRFPQCSPSDPDSFLHYHNANNADGSARYVNHPPSHPLSLGHLEDPIVIPDRTFEEQIALDVHLSAYTAGGRTRATRAIECLGSR